MAGNDRTQTNGTIKYERLKAGNDRTQTNWIIKNERGIEMFLWQEMTGLKPMG